MFQSNLNCWILLATAFLLLPKCLWRYSGSLRASNSWPKLRPAILSAEKCTVQLGKLNHNETLFPKKYQVGRLPITTYLQRLFDRTKHHNRAPFEQKIKWRFFRTVRGSYTRGKYEWIKFGNFLTIASQSWSGVRSITIAIQNDATLPAECIAGQEGWVGEPSS